MAWPSLMNASDAVVERLYHPDVQFVQDMMLDRVATPLPRDVAFCPAGGAIASRLVPDHRPFARRFRRR